MPKCKDCTQFASGNGCKMWRETYWQYKLRNPETERICPLFGAKPRGCTCASCGHMDVLIRNDDTPHAEPIPVCRTPEVVELGKKIGAPDYWGIVVDTTKERSCEYWVQGNCPHCGQEMPRTVQLTEGVKGGQQENRPAYPRG